MVNKILFEDIYPFVRDAKRYTIKEKTLSPVANYDNLLVYILKGKAQFKIEDSIYNMEHGDALIIRAGTFYEYTPLEVKRTVVGYGRAEKQQVQQMVKVMLKLDKIPKPDDAADALAIAICHSFSSLMAIAARMRAMAVFASSRLLR